MSSEELAKDYESVCKANRRMIDLAVSALAVSTLTLEAPTLFTVLAAYSATMKLSISVAQSTLYGAYLLEGRSKEEAEKRSEENLEELKKMADPIGSLIEFSLGEAGKLGYAASEFKDSISRTRSGNTKDTLLGVSEIWEKFRDFICTYEQKTEPEKANIIRSSEGRPHTQTPSTFDPSTPSTPSTQPNKEGDSESSD